MKITERILDFFGIRRGMRLGFSGYRSDMSTAIYAIRARAYLKITGKTLNPVGLDQLKTSDTDATDISRDLSPSRRLLRG